MFGFDEDTPIYNQMMRERESTPIFDELSKKYNYKKQEELVEPYQPDSKKVYSHLEVYLLTNKEQLMEKWQRLVNEFRNAMDLPVSEFPRTLTDEEANLHIQMIRDEFEKEFVPAFLEKDLVEMYDAGIDIIVYVLGAMSNAGFDVDPGMVEVMRSNMSKMDPETGKAIKAGPNDPSGEPEGKVLKGEAYFPPNLVRVLEQQSDRILGDDIVYQEDHIPLTFGEGGPEIGDASLVMDHRGNVTITGTVKSRDLFPEVLSVSVQDHYAVKSEDVAPIVDLEEGLIPEHHSLLTETKYESGVEGGIHIFPTETEKE